MSTSIRIIVDLLVCSITSNNEDIRVVETVARGPSTNQILLVKSRREFWAFQCHIAHWHSRACDE